MMTTANDYAAGPYAAGRPGWGPRVPPGPRFGRHGFGPPWAGPPWAAAPWAGPWATAWHLRRFAGGGPFWILATVLGFLLWWPVGLAVLLFGIGRKTMGCGRYRRWAMAQAASEQAGGAAGDGRGGRWAPPWAGWGACHGGAAQQTPTSGNHAFDEYRADTLRRLEEEQKDFASFLERLRFAKDKAEFDAFMAERRQHPQPPAEPPAEPAQA